MTYIHALVHNPYNAKKSLTVKKFGVFHKCKVQRYFYFLIAR